jgi:histidyl-tRNA synthetase
LDGLNIGNYKVKLNHRKLLDALMDVCGVPAEKFRPICSAIDKLDKEPWSKVRDEMVNQKGLDGAVADRIGTYVTMEPGRPMDLLTILRADSNFGEHKQAQEAFDELELMFKYMDAMNCIHRVSFDLSLARGLDYYTGVIYEAMLTDTDQVGSIAAGGRYDNLVGMFSSKPVPAVGVSIGIERIFAILEGLERKRGKIRATSTQVLVASVGKELLPARMAVCAELWANGVKAEFLYDLNPKPKKQMDFALDNGIPLILWLGEDEMAKGIVKIKDMIKREEVEVPRENMLQEVQRLIASQ